MDQRLASLLRRYEPSLNHSHEGGRVAKFTWMSIEEKRQKCYWELGNNIGHIFR